MLASAVDFALVNRDRFRVAVSWMGTTSAAVSGGERFAEYRRLVGRLYALLAEAIDAGKNDESVRTGVDTPTLVAELLGTLLGALLVELNAPEVARRVPAAAHWEGLAGGIVRLVLAGLRCPATDGRTETNRTPWSDERGYDGGQTPRAAE